MICYVVFLGWCCLLGWIDISSRRLPNTLTGVGALAVVLYAVVSDVVVPVLAGGATLFLCYLVVHIALPAAFGAGDVKLSFALGGVASLAGLDGWVLAAVLAPLLTGAVGVVLAALGRGGSTVPHGPSMCSATLLALAAFPT